ncbi:MAG: general secretion pathway protein B [Psychromonas sp.]|jgi:general secretion pathway protein B
MSTILAALQKQKSSAGGPFVPPLGAEKGLFKWRVALLTSLLVIISLLSILLYRQLIGEANGIKSQQSIAPDKAPDVIEASPKLTEVIPLVDSETAIKLTNTAPKAVKEMTFATQPLPEVEKPEPKIIVAPDAANLKNDLDYSSVSDQMQQRFEIALQDTSQQDNVSSVEISSDGRDLHEMASQFQKKVPSIRYDVHMYSSIAQDRWIKVNGKKLREGQFDAQGKIQLLEIQPNRSIFRLGRQSFSLESLTDWKGY